MNAGNGLHGASGEQRSHPASGPSEQPGVGRRYVLLTVADLRLAVAIDQVERVVHAVAIAADAALPRPFAGWVNLHGEPVAALDLRCRLGLAQRPLQLGDRLVLVRRGALRWFLVADAVLGVVEIADAALQRGAAEGGSVDCSSSQAVLEDGVAAVLDIARLLTAEQVNAVQRARAARPAVEEGEP